ncbi:hypothetical protein GBQ70_00540 [Halomicrobium sp. ZPS1]|uniref:Uncharacterized protein n=1 Tax=Halomicrobium mukohataei TaxID=57705 RepID=A0A4D6KFB9_9EURY|nr:hypothetical protein E5139_00540 [Halomicrobium mukohataei]QFR18992.1 hypothetical protein GBQ70_00540 [Halomicrobium sp. ZPS1]
MLCLWEPSEKKPPLAVALGRAQLLPSSAPPPTAPSGVPIVTIETIYTPIALLSCDRVCIDFQWLLYRENDRSRRVSRYSVARAACVERFDGCRGRRETYHSK